MTIEHCFNLALRKSSRLITQFYEDRFSTVGLKVGQFSILRAVNFAKETTNKHLQSVLVLDQTTLTRNLKPLLRDGYLQQKPHPEDSRQKLISLTEAGKTLYEKAEPIWKTTQLELQQNIGCEETDKILEIADTFVQAFGNS